MKKQQNTVPSNRFSRLSSLGGLASRLAGNVLVEGVKKFSQGEKPTLNQLVMTPTNMTHIADKLAQLRGAAMKVGQILSMDSGNFLPEELTERLSRLRSDANAMPHKQLIAMLKDNWGAHWLDTFAHFELSPFAAASIGQVHLATLETGEKLAVKLQYPGVRNSIDSDIDNVAALLSASKVIPSHMHITPLLDEAKKQLHMEADYCHELKMLERFSVLTQQGASATEHTAQATSSHFIVPKVYRALCNQNILVMAFVEGQSIESTIELTQAVRNKLPAGCWHFFRRTF